ncbi:hypothetical protein DPMN_063030 [Dreissena polymorpha]|uniref:Uncharacterized protein n=1 Tax=Dreissena polymorpha TaxID=45954 RepID=A0A9D4CAN7_DREPO|nr:hypothetical protein DPMN_063030 [Dreissena polymorpha]
MFSYSFTKIHNDTDRHWCYLRFRLIHAYYHLHSLPPPFSVFYNVYAIVKLVFRRCKPDASIGTNAFCMKLNKSENEKLQRWETIHSYEETPWNPKTELHEEPTVPSTGSKTNPFDTGGRKLFSKHFKSKILRNQIASLYAIHDDEV